MREFFRKLFLPITAPIDFIQNHFKAVVLLLIVIGIVSSNDSESLKPYNLQKVQLVGPIFDASEVLKELDKAYNNDAVKGVLFEVNSPGGAVAPSVELSYAIKRLREKKPVVVYASGILASGSYYASIWANKIIANPGSMVGSIGVIMHGMNFEGLMKKIGVSSQVVQAGAYKQVGTADRKWTLLERAELEKVIHGTYQQFVGDVAAARDLNVSDANNFANAHIFTAAQAKKVGLIDALGVRYDAQAQLVALSGVKEPIWNKEDKMEKLLKKLTAESISLVQIYFPSISMR